jgi:hypothetical protein
LWIGNPENPTEDFPFPLGEDFPFPLWRPFPRALVLELECPLAETAEIGEGFDRGLHDISLVNAMSIVLHITALSFRRRLLLLPFSNFFFAIKRGNATLNSCAPTRR